MEIESLLNYLDDGLQRNSERLRDLEAFLKENPSKSIQKKNIHGGVYYCLMYRENGRVRQKYLGSKKRVDLKKERRSLEEYNRRLNEAKERYRDLKERNGKLRRVLNFVMKIYNEK